MSKKNEPKINPYTHLGVSDERANEMSEELTAISSESQDTGEILTSLAERYNPESLVMGMFLAAMIMKRERRLLPPGATIVGAVPLPSLAHNPSQN